MPLGGVVISCKPTSIPDIQEDFNGAGSGVNWGRKALPRVINLKEPAKFIVEVTGLMAKQYGQYLRRRVDTAYGIFSGIDRIPEYSMASTKLTLVLPNTRRMK